MELEQMKHLWQQQQELSQAQQKTNEQLIRRLIEGKSKSSLDRMLVYEYLSLGTCILVLLVFALCAGQMVFDTELYITYPLSILFLLLGLVWSGYKLSAFRKVDIARQSVKESKALITRIRMFYQQELRWAFALMPFLMAALLSVVFRIVYRHSILKHTGAYLFQGTIGCIVAWVILYYVYQKMYEPAFRRLLQDVEEIRDFE